MNALVLLVLLVFLLLAFLNAFGLFTLVFLLLLFVVWIHIFCVLALWLFNQTSFPTVVVPGLVWNPGLLSSYQRLVRLKQVVSGFRLVGV